MATKTQANPPCVLCRCKESLSLDELSGAQLRALWNAGGHMLSDAALAPIRPETPVILCECRNCGLRYYDPRLAGGAAFYEELMQSAPYAPTRPEFEYALRFAARRGLRSVLDVGGGEGAFLDMARQRNMETFGIELNRVAAAKTAHRGHHMIVRPLNEVSPEEVAGGVDLLTLFQVVEHVAAPREFVIEAARLVKPLGFLIVAVPNEYRGFGLMPYDPANWPPHHVSRWRRRNLAQLARGAGLRLVAIRGDVLYGSSIKWFWELHNEQARAIGRSPYLGGRWLPTAISWLYRALGCKYYFPRLGQSLYAVLQKC